ncbi:MAG TPA: hypothetical protein VND54_10440 [Candidatus Saccharimonadales bacterium]|nr:hypothetical protein [Candidatus Saccharimonadales bacterium]
MDSDGYGYAADDRGTARLLDDLRTFSPSAIERVARGWESYGRPHLDTYHAAEAAALHAIEEAHLTTGWETLQRQILDLTEGRTSLVSWKIEHGAEGHHAESAALGAALALHAAGHLDRAHFETLLRPMAEALPWLLSPPGGSA